MKLKIEMMTVHPVGIQMGQTTLSAYSVNRLIGGVEPWFL